MLSCVQPQMMFGVVLLHVRFVTSIHLSSDIWGLLACMSSSPLTPEAALEKFSLAGGSHHAPADYRVRPLPGSCRHPLAQLAPAMIAC